MVGQVREVGPRPQRRQSHLDHVEPVEQVLAEPARGDRRPPGRGWSRPPAARRPVRVCASPTRSYCAPGGTAAAWAAAAAAGRRSRRGTACPPRRRPPCRRCRARRPVNAPRAWPNSSLSSSSALRLGQLTVTNGPSARRLQAWMARASTPLPVPLSPRISTVASVGATRRASSRTPPTSGSRAVEVRLGHLGAGPAPPGRRPGRCSPRTRATRSSTARTWAGRERLGQVVEGAATHRLDGRVDAGVGGDDHDGQVGRARARLAPAGRDPTPRPAAGRRAAARSCACSSCLKAESRSAASATWCPIASRATLSVARMLASSSTIKIRMVQPAISHE